MSFLSVFASIVQAAESAALIMAPVVKVVRPELGGLLLAAAQQAVAVEALIRAPLSGEQRAEVVAEQTRASIEVVNRILVASGRAPLGADSADVIAAQVVGVVKSLNAVKTAVELASSTPAGVAAAGAAAGAKKT